jgi:hypothetical protein
LNSSSNGCPDYLHEVVSNKNISKDIDISDIGRKLKFLKICTVQFTVAITVKEYHNIVSGECTILNMKGY